MSDLFRKEALESFSSSSDINKGVCAVSIKTRAAVLVIAFCAAVFTLWLIFGTIYEVVPVSGIIWSVHSGGNVYALSEGLVKKTMVFEGDMVSVGDILAVMPDEAVLKKIEAGKANGISDADFQSLYEEYERNSIIRSFTNGIVTKIINDNTYVKKGDEIAEIVPYNAKGNNKILTAYIPAEKGGLVKVGMEAQVMPDFTTRAKHGYINAYISNVSNHPVTGRHIKETSGDLFLSSLDENKSYIRLEVTLLPDYSAKSNLKWSKASSGDIDVVFGTMCDADIVIKKCCPYEWLF